MASMAVLLKGNTAFLITYQSLPECHDEYLDPFEVVIGSFKFE